MTGAWAGDAGGCPGVACAGCCGGCCADCAAAAVAATAPSTTVSRILFISIGSLHLWESTMFLNNLLAAYLWHIGTRFIFLAMSFGLEQSPRNGAKPGS